MELSISSFEKLLLISSNSIFSVVTVQFAASYFFRNTMASASYASSKHSLCYGWSSSWKYETKSEPLGPSLSRLDPLILSITDHILALSYKNAFSMLFTALLLYSHISVAYVIDILYISWSGFPDLSRTLLFRQPWRPLTWVVNTDCRTIGDHVFMIYIYIILFYEMLYNLRFVQNTGTCYPGQGWLAGTWAEAERPKPRCTWQIQQRPG